MKYVVESTQVAHLWANYTNSAHQESARNGRNFSFCRGVLTSYTTDIARLVIVKPATGTGKRHREAVRVCLMNERDYSVTTRKQKHWAWLALRGHNVESFNVSRLHDVGPGNESDIRHNVESMARRFAPLAEKARKARDGKAGYLASLASAIDTANRYAKTFKLAGFKPYKIARVMPDHTAELAKVPALAARKAERDANRETRNAELAAKRAALQAIADAKFAADSAAIVAEWKAGRYVSLSGDYRLQKLVIAGLGYEAGSSAMAIDGDDVKTSQGASVPASHVRRILPIVLRLIDNGTTYETPPDEPIRVGSFQLNRVDASGMVKVGCHQFPAVEVRRINAILNPA